MSETMIADHPPNDGREWDCQCARCGSSTGTEDCSNCIEGYSHHNCGEDSCGHADDPYNYNVRCDWCRGRGFYRFCLSGEEWCNAHPMNGREEIRHGAIEWFVTHPSRAGGR